MPQKYIITMPENGKPTVNPADHTPPQGETYARLTVLDDGNMEITELNMGDQPVNSKDSNSDL